jgi:tetratricopeptide (TPR) repeat protein
MTDGRRRIRRMLLLGSIPFALAGLILAVKLVSLSVVAGVAIDSYESGSFESSADAAGELLTWNAFEPWVAHFDRGTARAGAGLYNEAVDDLERAFAEAPDEKKCDVAVNLSLSWELLGDSYLEQGQFAGAQRLYETARAVIAAAGEGCEPPNAPLNTEENRDPGEELRDAGERLDEKIQDAKGLNEQADAHEENAPDGTEEQLDRLEQQNQDAAEEKAEQQGQDRGNEGTGGFTEKPW